MSKRRIRFKKTKKQSSATAKEGIVYMNSTYPIIDHQTGEIDVRSVSWEMTYEEMKYMPVYRRAHELMPRPRSFIMNFEEYKDELQSSIDLLENARNGKIVETDALLRALGILGHSPQEESIRELSVFAESSHALAPVANLALAECASMYSDNRERMAIAGLAI